MKNSATPRVGRYSNNSISEEDHNNTATNNYNNVLGLLHTYKQINSADKPQSKKTVHNQMNACLNAMKYMVVTATITINNYSKLIQTNRQSHQWAPAITKASN